MKPPRRRLAVVTAAVLGLGLSTLAGTSADAVVTPPWRVVPFAPSASDVFVESVVSVAGGGAFAVGEGRTFLPGTFEDRTHVQRWTGTAWQVMSTPDRETEPTRDRLIAVAASSPTDVWAVGNSYTSIGDRSLAPLALHYDGTSWRIVDTPKPAAGGSTSMTAVSARTSTDVWAVGEGGGFLGAGAVWHYDGSAWSVEALARPAGCSVNYPVELTSVTQTAAGDVYVGGYCVTAKGYRGLVLRRTTSGWPIVAKGPAHSQVNAIIATPDAGIWAVGEQDLSSTFGTVKHGFALVGAGASWTKVSHGLAPNISESWEGVASTPAGIVVVGNVGSIVSGFGRAQVLTRTGTRWVPSTVPVPSDGSSWLSDVSTSPTGQVWSVGRAPGAHGQESISARP